MPDTDQNVRSAREVAGFLIIFVIGVMACAGIGSSFFKGTPHATDVVQPIEVGSPR